MRWPWQSAPVEHRSSLTDQVITAILAAATGGGAVLSAFESAAATPQTPEKPPTAEEWLDRCDANDNGRVTCAEARAEACGAPIPVTKDHPLYQFMRDGDGDGQVCE